MRIVRITVQYGRIRGFLEKCRVDFEGRMTCIIGARGTCKSTLVESIQFAFDADRDLVAKLVSPEGMIAKTLGAGSVTCLLEVIEDGQASEYAIEREIGGVPRLARGGVRDTLAETSYTRSRYIRRVRCSRIASSDKPQLRLSELIDRPNRDNIRHLQKQMEVQGAELKDIGSNLRLNRGDIDKRRLEVRDLEPLGLISDGRFRRDRFYHQLWKNITLQFVRTTACARFAQGLARTPAAGDQTPRGHRTVRRQTSSGG